MATALARIYTPEGFVVAADGRVRNSSTGEVVRDDMQKVFHFGNTQLAFSFTGAAHLGRADRDDSGEVLFDFIQMFATSVQAYSAQRCPTLQSYATRLSKRVQGSLEERMREGNIELPDLTSRESGELGCTIVHVYIDGYYEGVPSKVAIRFFHESQRLRESEVRIEPLDPGRFMFHGIGEIGKLVVSHDASLARYFEPFYEGHLTTPEMITAITLSRAFIEACGGSEGAKINRDASRSIGGRTHIATVDAKFGFQWVPGFAAL